MPWVGIYISKIGTFLPYLIFGITSGLGYLIFYYIIIYRILFFLYIQI